MLLARESPANDSWMALPFPCASLVWTLPPTVVTSLTASLLVSASLVARREPALSAADVPAKTGRQRRLTDRRVKQSQSFRRRQSRCIWCRCTWDRCTWYGGAKSVSPLMAAAYHSKRLAFREAGQSPQLRRVAQFSQRLGLDLPNALPGHVEFLTYLLQSPVDPIANPESHSHHLLLTRGQGSKYFADVLDQIHLDRRVGRGNFAFVRDEVSQPGGLVIAHGQLDRDRVARHPDEVANLVDR